MNYVLKNWYWWVIFGLLPFFHTTWLPEPFEEPKVLLFICVTFMYLAQLSRSVTNPIIYVKKSRIIMIYGGFLLTLLISSLLGINFNNSLFGQYYRYQGLITQISLFLFVILTASNFVTAGNFNLGRVLTVSGWLNCGLIIGQAILFFGLGWPMYQDNGRMTGFFGNPNFAGMYLAVIFPLVVNNIKQSKYKLLTAMLFLVAILLTQSRSGLIGIALAMGLELFWVNKIKIDRKILLVLILGCLTLGFLYPRRPISSFDRREVIWSKAFEAIGQRPLFGWGLENFEFAFSRNVKTNEFDLKNIRVDKAHNETLEILISSGIVGLICYLGLMLTTWRILWSYRKSAIIKVTLSTLVVFLIMTQFNVTGINTYLILGIPIAMAIFLEISGDKFRRSVQRK